MTKKIPIENQTGGTKVYLTSVFTIKIIILVFLLICIAISKCGFKPEMMSIFIIYFGLEVIFLIIFTEKYNG